MDITMRDWIDDCQNHIMAITKIEGGMYSHPARSTAGMVSSAVMTDMAAVIAVMDRAASDEEGASMMSPTVTIEINGIVPGEGMVREQHTFDVPMKVRVEAVRTERSRRGNAANYQASHDAYGRDKSIRPRRDWYGRDYTDER